MKLFSFWQTFVRARFIGVCLLTKTVFQLSWKKSLRSAIFGLVVWTTFRERIFFPFMKILNFWVPAHFFFGKVHFFLKKSENNIFTKKKIFFLQWGGQGVSGGPPGDKLFFSTYPLAGNLWRGWPMSIWPQKNFFT